MPCCAEQVPERLDISTLGPCLQPTCISLLSASFCLLSANRPPSLPFMLPNLHHPTDSDGSVSREMQSASSFKRVRLLLHSVQTTPQQKHLTQSLSLGPTQISMTPTSP